MRVEIPDAALSAQAVLGGTLGKRDQHEAVSPTV
jgi:hypothetical protein